MAICTSVCDKLHKFQLECKFTGICMVFSVIMLFQAVVVAMLVEMQNKMCLAAMFVG